MEPITVTTTISAPLETIWEAFTTPKDIIAWNSASDDWHTVRAVNDVRIGGTFTYRMEAKDGSIGFDFAGTYTDVVAHERLAYVMEDGRRATITFIPEGEAVRVTEVFDPEHENTIELQRQGWQAILDRFKSYVEGK